MELGLASVASGLNAESTPRRTHQAVEDIAAHLVHFRYPTRDIFQVRLTLKATGAELNVLVAKYNEEAKKTPQNQAALQAAGLTEDEAWRQAGFRIFGSPPGTSVVSMSNTSVLANTLR